MVRAKVRLGDTEQHYITVEAGLPEGVVAVQRIGKDQLVPRESLGAVDALDRKPVAVTVEEALPAQAVAGTRVDVWVALPDAKNGFSEPKLLLPGAEIAEVTAGSTALGSSRSTVLMVLVADSQMPALLGAQANEAKISVVWNPGGAATEHPGGHRRPGPGRSGGRPGTAARPCHCGPEMRRTDRAAGSLPKRAGPGGRRGRRVRGTDGFAGGPAGCGRRGDHRPHGQRRGSRQAARDRRCVGTDGR